jgi:putative hydrolase of the HAD superfamily
MRLFDSQRGSEFLEITAAYNLSAVMQESGLGQPPQSVIKAALKARYAVSQSCYKTEEGVVPVLEGLRAAGYRLGIVSNASDDDDVQTLIDNARLRPYFDVIVSSAAQGIRKPNPRIFLNVLSQLGVEPGRAIMVGDMLGADILGAHNAGIYAVWITRRADKAANRDHLDTIQPDAVIASIDELPGLLDSL